MARMYCNEVQVTGKRHSLQVFVFFKFLSFVLSKKIIIFKSLSSKLVSPPKSINAVKLDLAYLK